jgi:hypothetical protein
MIIDDNRLSWFYHLICMTLDFFCMFSQGSYRTLSWCVEFYTSLVYDVVLSWCHFVYILWRTHLSGLTNHFLNGLSFVNFFGRSGHRPLVCPSSVAHKMHSMWILWVRSMWWFMFFIISHVCWCFVGSRVETPSLPLASFCWSGLESWC